MSTIFISICLVLFIKSTGCENDEEISRVSVYQHHLHRCHRHHQDHINQKLSAEENDEITGLHLPKRRVGNINVTKVGIAFSLIGAIALLALIIVIMCFYWNNWLQE